MLAAVSAFLGDLSVEVVGSIIAAPSLLSVLGLGEREV